MTLRQEAYAMIDSLPDDDSIRFFIDMIRRFNVVTKKTQEISGDQNSLFEKRQAFLHMEELKKKYPFPKDYDYEQVRRENMEEKYGCID
ncbi:MAG: hypothetical protein K2K21_17695 [Lachnospiraceae bacterium]|nr:hypothetical protein [Lachnospiraceae bacterium]